MPSRLPCLLALLAAACGPSEVEVQEASDPRSPAPAPGTEAAAGVLERRELPGGLVLSIREPGRGRQARIGDVLRIHYRVLVLPRDGEAAEAGAAPEDAPAELPGTEPSEAELPEGGPSAAEAGADDAPAEPAPAAPTDEGGPAPGPTGATGPPGAGGPALLRSTYAAGVPDRVRLGTDPLIPGLRRALVGLRAGCRVDIRVPAALAYGDTGLEPGVPPGSDLLFELELVDVTR